MKRSRIAAVALLAFAGTAAAAFSQTIPAARAKLSYPPAQRDATVDTYFGTKVPAPYQWMENLGSPALQQWVEAENALTSSYLAEVPVRSWIQQRLTQLWNYAKVTTPEQVAGRPDLLRQELGSPEPVGGLRRATRRRPRRASCSTPTRSRRTARSRCSATRPRRAARTSRTSCRRAARTG